MDGQKEYQHPVIVRLTHWINFLALGIMVTSGLKIYNASALFDFTFPSILVLGGWLAGARQWHFFAMWLFVLNGVIYLGYNLISYHGRSTTLFRRTDVSGVLPMIRYYLRLQKDHPPQKKYNSLQKLAYTIVPLLAIGAIFSGIGIYWPVQFQEITRIFGGYEAARIWHFIFMAGMVFFFLGHLIMVMVAGWSNFFSMITGWTKKESNELKTKIICKT